MTVELIQHVLNGLILGSTYALIAIGLTTIFGVLGVINLAHGEFYMLGSLVAYFLVTWMGGHYFVAFFLSMILVGGFGVVVEKIVFRPVRQAPLLTILLVSIGLSIFLQSSALIAVGPDLRRIPGPFGSRVLSFLGVTLTAQRLLIFATALILIALLYALFKYTKIGKAVRATAQDRDGAALAGIPVNTVYAVTFAMGTGLAAAAGCLVGPIFFIDPFMGFMPAIKSFIVVILGGLGSLPGAILGGLVLGLAEVLGAAYISSEYKDSIAFIILILILVVRPTGFMGVEAEEA